MSAPPSHQQQQRDESDRLLLDRVVAGDRDAFARLYIAYHRRLARFLTATDAALRARRGDYQRHDVGGVATGGQVPGRIARFDLDHRHCLSARVEIPEEPRAEADRDCARRSAALVAPDELGEAETAEWILLGMKQLPVEQRLALEFAYGHGHSCEEIAEIMNCPVNTVKTRLFHARAKLRALLPGLAGALPQQ